MNRSILLVVVPFLVATLACRQFLAPDAGPGAPTPEEAVRQMPPLADPAVAGTLRIIARRQVDDTVIVFYRYTEPAADAIPARPAWGYNFTERTARGWVVRGGAGAASDPPPGPGVLVDFLTHRGSTERLGPFVMIVGVPLAPEVAAVEATFDTGQTIGDQAGDGAFALLAAGASEACDVRVLDETGQVLLRFSLADEPDKCPDPAHTSKPAGL